MEHSNTFTDLRRLLLITIFISLSFKPIFSQGRKSLDNEYGLSQIKLEAKFSQFKNNVKYEWIDSKGTEFYEYTKDDLKFIFGKKVKGIYLAFVDNRLYNITVVFGVLTPKETIELMNVLTNKYDIPSIGYPGGNLEYAAVWETGKVYMQLEEYVGTSELFENETQLFWISKPLEKILKMK